ncbi:ImmA/IrrE family metallo-endopeptidase, partial [Spirosoma terrae]
TDPRHEQEAFYLGATLQLPRVALSWAVHGEQMTVEEIAKKFVASRQMVQYRINVMGLSKDMKLLQTERQ